MTVTPVSKLSEFEEIIKGDTPVVVDFWATWCGPCRLISPIFEQIAEQTANVKFLKVDTDEAQEIARKAQIRAMPTFIAYQNGQPIGQLLGARPAELKKLIDVASAKAPETKADA